MRDAPAGSDVLNGKEIFQQEGVPWLGHVPVRAQLWLGMGALAGSDVTLEGLRVRVD